FADFSEPGNFERLRLSGIVDDYLWGVFAHLDLRAHSLNLGLLLSRRCDKSGNLSLQLCDCCSLLVYFTMFLGRSAMLLQELIKQHGVHLVVAHRVRRSIFVS